MKADRLISILMILQANRHITASELAARFDVSIRTIFRDVDALSGIGVPLYTNRGQNGGIKLLEDYNVTLSGLTTKELYYLFIPSSNKVMTDLGIEKPDDSTLLNLFKTLPADKVKVLKGIQNRLYIDSESWRGRENEEDNGEKLLTLQTAIWKPCVVSLMYKEKQKTINPLALVLKGFTWYCVALDQSMIKAYRVSLMKEMRSTDTHFERPDDFNLEEYWNNSMKTFRKKLPSYIVTIKTDKETYEHMKLRRLKIQQTDNVEGGYHLIIRFDALFQAAEVMMGYGGSVHIEKPRELIDEILIRARGIIDHY